MFSSKAAQAQTAVPKPAAPPSAEHPINPAWQALATSVAGRDVSAALPRAVRKPSTVPHRLSAGGFTIRRAVPVNVPHPENEPAGAGDEDEEAGVWPLRRALKVGRSHDPMELEADQVADRVMRMPDGAGVASDATTLRPVTPGTGGRMLAPATRS